MSFSLHLLRNSHIFCSIMSNNQLQIVQTRKITTWLSVTVCHGKSPFFIGKPSISMGHFPWQTVSHNHEKVTPSWYFFRVTTFRKAPSLTRSFWGCGRITAYNHGCGKQTLRRCCFWSGNEDYSRFSQPSQQQN